MKKYQLLFISLMTLLLFSCATITRGKLARPKVLLKDAHTNKPLEKAEVFVNGQFAGVTSSDGTLRFPMDEVNKTKEYALKVSKSGYVPINMTISNKVDGGAMAGNIMLFFVGIVPGVVGIATDAATGNWKTFKGTIKLSMQPAK